jgi:GDPmannose 4,6-dehydratase
MLKKDKPEDYVLSTNETHSVKKFVEKAFSLKGFNIESKGEGCPSTSRVSRSPSGGFLRGVG